MNKTYYAIGGFASLTLLALFASALFTGQKAEANVYTATNIQAATTSAAFAITTSARVLATTTSITGTSYTRVYATICNPNANPVVLNLGQDKAADLNGAMTTVIAAAAGYNVCYEVTDRNEYQGSITASSTNETSTKITVKDYVQQ